MSDDVGPVRIARLVDLEAEGVDDGSLLTGVASIFRETAARWPDNDVAARAFQDLWLDQYIRHERELVWLAVPERSPATVAGYLVGCRIDPALSPRFETLTYFQAFAQFTKVYPAHLHTNVTALYRNRRVGERLVEAFCAQLRSERMGGVHVVTGRNQRNVPFYTRLGFRECAAAPRGGAEVLFMARPMPH